MKKYVVLFCLITCYLLSFGQVASQSGIYGKYAMNKVKKVTEYIYLYTSKSKCDSTPFKIQSFNIQGQLIQESYRGIGKRRSYYTFEYNSEGFLIDIDTNGMLIYSDGSSDISDTIIETKTISEKWMLFKNESRLIETITKTNDDSVSIKKTIEYNQRGDITIEQFYEKNDTMDYKKISSVQYFYNINGLLEKIISTNENKQIDCIYEYNYEYFD